jgi:hypothetical protein
VAGRARMILTVVGLVTAMPVAAQAPGSPSAFDGKYTGVSADVSKYRSRGERCPREHIPDALTITNGAVHSAGRDRWSGTVDPQGALVIRNRRAMRVNGQIDPQGTMKGEYHGPACIVTYVWHKQSA